MRQRVLKYQLGNLPRTVLLPVPAGFTARSIGVQDGRLVVWGETPIYEDPFSAGQEVRRLHVLFTGDALPTDAIRFLGTETIDGLVYHVYEGGLE